MKVTPADHAWQNASPGASDRIFERRGLLRVLDRDPGRHHLGARRLPAHPRASPADAGPDAMLFDFSDSEWHFGLDGAVEMANAYPDTPLLLYHWG